MDGGEILVFGCMGAVCSRAMSERSLIEARSTEEGLVPQPEHVEAGEGRCDQTDEPERIAQRTSA